MMDFRYWYQCIPDIATGGMDMEWILRDYVEPLVDTTNRSFEKMVQYVNQYESVVELTLISQRSDPPFLAGMLQQWIYQPLEGMASGLSEAARLDLATATFLLPMLLAFPLSLVFRAIPGRAAKNIFALTAGVILAQFVFGVAWIHGILSAGVAYVLIYTTMCIPPLQKFVHVVIFLWMMLYLSVAHIYRMKVRASSPDFVGKLKSFGSI